MAFSAKSYYLRMRRRGILIAIAAMVAVLAIVQIRKTALVDAYDYFTLYFETNIHGLSVGAPVRISGQTVGQVDEIAIASVERNNVPRYYAAVTVRLKSSKLRSLISFPENKTFGDILPKLIDDGLRGQLRMPSLLANGLCLDLFFAPRQPAFTANIPDSPYPEIPTNYKSTSDYVDRANAFIETKKLGEFVEKIRMLKSLLVSLETTLSGIDCRTINSNTLSALSTANSALSQNLTQHSIAELNRTLTSLNNALESQGVLSREQTEEALAAFKNFRNALGSISVAADLIRTRLEPDQSALITHILSEINKLLR